MLLPNPESLDLTEKEAHLYELLINRGENEVPKLVELTGYKRPTVYRSLETLAAKGLVREVKIGQKTLYRPESPQQLLEMAQNRFSVADKARSDVMSLLPTLVAAYTLSSERPVVNTFQGVAGLKRIYEQMLLSKEQISAILYTGEVEPELFRWLTGEFTSRRVASQIPVRSIVASGGWAQEYERESAESFRETRLIDSEKFPIKHEIDIFGDQIAFIDFRAGGTLIGVLINHPDLANSMRGWFELTWSSLR